MNELAARQYYEDGQASVINRSRKTYRQIHRNRSRIQPFKGDIGGRK